MLDEADALLLDRELAISGPPRRVSYRVVSGGTSGVKKPETCAERTAVPQRRNHFLVHRFGAQWET